MAAEKIEALRNVDFVAISIDSLDEAKNDSIKDVPGAWKKAMEAVESFTTRESTLALPQRFHKKISMK